MNASFLTITTGILSKISILPKNFFERKLVLGVMTSFNTLNYWVSIKVSSPRNWIPKEKKWNKQLGRILSYIPFAFPVIINDPLFKGCTCLLGKNPTHFKKKILIVNKTNHWKFVSNCPQFFFIFVSMVSFSCNQLLLVLQISFYP